MEFDKGFTVFTINFHAKFSSLATEKKKLEGNLRF